MIIVLTRLKWYLFLNNILIQRNQYCQFICPFKDLYTSIIRHFPLEYGVNI